MAEGKGSYSQLTNEPHLPSVFSIWRVAKEDAVSLCYTTLNLLLVTDRQWVTRMCTGTPVYWTTLISARQLKSPLPKAGMQCPLQGNGLPPVGGHIPNCFLCLLTSLLTIFLPVKDSDIFIFCLKPSGAHLFLNLWGRRARKHFVSGNSTIRQKALFWWYQGGSCGHCKRNMQWYSVE